MTFDEVRSIDAIVANPAQRTALTALIRERADISEQERAFDKRKQEINSALRENLFEKYDATSVRWEDIRVDLEQGRTSRLSKDKLLGFGVAPEVIEKSTEITVFQKVVVRRRNGNG